MGLFHCQISCQREQRVTPGIISTGPWTIKKRIKWKGQSLHKTRYETVIFIVGQKHDSEHEIMAQVGENYDLARY